MAWYKIYAGLGGGFGGAEYKGTFEFKTEEEAMQEAYECAIDDYESYAGYHGILDWEECKQDCIDSGWGDDDATVNDRYQEEIESWINYYVDLATGPDDVEEY